MTALFGSFWFSPDGKLEETLGKSHADHMGGLISAVDALEKGRVRVGANIHGGLQLYIEGKPQAIERAKDTLLEHWGYAPEEIVIDVLEVNGHTTFNTAPEEFYGMPFSDLVRRAKIHKGFPLFKRRPDTHVREYRRKA